LQSFNFDAIPNAKPLRTFAGIALKACSMAAAYVEKRAWAMAGTMNAIGFTLSTGVLPQPFLPGGLGAVEDVDVGIAPDAGHDAGARILPEGEGVRAIAHGRVAGDRTQPVGIAVEGRKLVVVEEVDRGVDDRLLAVVLLDDG